MHSAIFQLELEVVDKDDYMDEDTIIDKDGFLGVVADYVYNSENREETIRECIFENSLLLEHGLIFNKNEMSVIFTQDFLESYFSKRLVAFKDLAEAVTLKDMMTMGPNLYLTQKMITNKYDYYIYHDYYLQPLDSFLREAKPGVKYYFGGAVGYHF